MSAPLPTASKRPWMPIFVADYLTKTSHLSSAECGAYVHLLMHYWLNNGLPEDEEQIARISRLTPKEWGKSRATLRSLFSPGWVEKKLDAEILKMVDTSDKRRKAATRMHAAHAANAGASAYANAGANHHAKGCANDPTNHHANDLPLHTTHTTRSPSQEIKGAFSVVGEGETPQPRDKNGEALSTRGAA